jgi:BON domain
MKTTFLIAPAASGTTAPQIIAPVTPAAAQTGVNPSGRVLLTPQQQEMQRQGIQPNGTNATTTISTNTVNNGVSNQFGAGTNGLLNTNNLGGNSNSLPETAASATGNFVISDRAVTLSDRNLLTLLKQGVAAQFGTTASGQTPVHFLIDNGAVTLTGVVPTADESQRIAARVQQTPGVLSVFNDLHVGTGSTASQSSGGALSTPLTGAISDHAFSPADQALLSQVQQEAGMQLGINGASTAQMPVHFSIQNGVVGVIGQVVSQQEKAALLAAIQRTPGVNRVVDNVMVVPGNDNTSTPSATVLNPEIQNGILPATSRDMAHTNNFMLNTTNSSGF